MHEDEELLMISGIQHFAFCERQWALIHIEQQWNENKLTVEGHHLHKRVDNPFIQTSNKNSILLRSLPISCIRLGIYGISDAVEFLQCESDSNTIKLISREGWWKPVPVEYKRGEPKPDERDEVQLCAQAICLEEMYKIEIPHGFLFYGETRHRHKVEFTVSLRNLVDSLSKKMHELFSERITPKPEYKSHCKSCSLFNICLPKSMSSANKVQNYLNQAFSPEKPEE